MFSFATKRGEEEPWKHELYNMCHVFGGGTWNKTNEDKKANLEDRELKCVDCSKFAKDVTKNIDCTGSTSHDLQITFQRPSKDLQSACPITFKCPIKWFSNDSAECESFQMTLTWPCGRSKSYRSLSHTAYTTKVICTIFMFYILFLVSLFNFFLTSFKISSRIIVKSCRRPSRSAAFNFVWLLRFLINSSIGVLRMLCSSSEFVACHCWNSLLY